MTKGFLTGKQLMEQLPRRELERRFNVALQCCLAGKPIEQVAAESKLPQEMVQRMHDSYGKTGIEKVKKAGTT
jgi:hypothetical protein